MVELPITDNHIHVDPYNGNGALKVAKIFEKAGGKNLFVIGKPSKSYGITLRKEEDFKRVFSLVTSFVEEINKETNVRAFAVVGPYPSEIENLLERYSLKESVEIMKGGIDIAIDMVENGDAVAVGEIGREHYPVTEDRFRASTEIMKYGIEEALKRGIAVQIHAEEFSEEQCRELSKIGKKFHFSDNKIVRHFAKPYVKLYNEYGITPSILANYNNVKIALNEGKDFLLETDYIDDLKRPGAVLGPRNVPRVTFKLMKENLLNEEDIYKIHKDLPEKIYGVECKT